MRSSHRKQNLTNKHMTKSTTTQMAINAPSIQRLADVNLRVQLHTGSLLPLVTHASLFFAANRK